MSQIEYQEAMINPDMGELVKKFFKAKYEQIGIDRFQRGHFRPVNEVQVLELYNKILANAGSSNLKQAILNDDTTTAIWAAPILARPGYYETIDGQHRVGVASKA